jgi:hypothetical protein
MQAETAETDKGSTKTGLIATAVAILAFIACNGLFILVAVLSSMGIILTINPHAQAAVISLFALVTLIMVFISYRKNKTRGPLILCVVGAITVVGTMYIHYDKIIESVGLLVLFISALWSWRVARQQAW